MYDGTTVYINGVVDQAGLVLSYDSFASGSVVPTPASLRFVSHYSLHHHQWQPRRLPWSPQLRGDFACAVLVVSGSLWQLRWMQWPTHHQWPSHCHAVDVHPRRSASRIQPSPQSDSANPTAADEFLLVSINTQHRPCPRVPRSVWPSVCGPLGDSQLLATTAPYTFIPGQLAGSTASVIALALISPLIVGPGNYTILAESDNSNLNIMVGNAVAGSQSLVADAYTKNPINTPMPIRAEEK